jgi:hypothetical protein
MNRITFTILWIFSGLMLLLALTLPHADATGQEDPHLPDWTQGYCPGGGPGISMNAYSLPNIQGFYGFCDGEPYADNTFIHQVAQANGLTGFGAQVHSFCNVNHGSMFSPPAPPGGCDGLQQ